MVLPHLRQQSYLLRDVLTCVIQNLFVHAMSFTFEVEPYRGLDLPTIVVILSSHPMQVTSALPVYCTQGAADVEEISWHTSVSQ